MSSGPPFTPDEDARIRELVATHTYAQIAALLGRSRNAVASRATELGAPTVAARRRRRPRSHVGYDLAREIAAARAEMATAPLYRGGWP